MLRFTVEIRGDRDQLDRALDALVDAGIGATRREGGGRGRTINHLAAHPHADSAEAAIAEIRQHIPADGDYTLGPANPAPLPGPLLGEPGSAPPAGIERYRALALRRVLVAETQTGDQLRVQAVHLYEDAVRVHFVLPQGMGDDEEGGWHGSRMALTDDLGTQYYPAGGGSGGTSGDGWSAFHAHNWFTPAVPGGASRLTVATLVGDLTFDL
jgi:hypothetical protein